MDYKFKYKAILTILTIIILTLTVYSSLIKCDFNVDGQGHWIYFNFRFKGEEALIEVDIHINITDKPNIKTIALIIPYTGDFVKISYIPPSVNITYNQQLKQVYIIWNLSIHNITYPRGNSTYKGLTILYALRSIVKIEDHIFKAKMKLPYLKEINKINYRIFGKAPAGKIEVLKSNIPYKRIVYNDWFWRGELYFSQEIRKVEEEMEIEIWWRNRNPIEEFIFSLKRTFTPTLYYTTINITTFIIIYTYKYGKKIIKSELIGLPLTITLYIIFAAASYWLPIQYSLYSIAQYYHLIPIIVIRKILKDGSTAYIYSALTSSTILFLYGLWIMTIFDT